MKLKIFAISLFLLPGLNGLQAQTIKDIDGNTYNAVTIGKQVWLKENLNVTHYNDGTNIPVVTDSATWVNLSSPGMCWHGNSKEANTANKYGALYNWYVVGTGKLCPTGWHVSTNAEWIALTDFLGEEAAEKLKDTGTVWQPGYSYESEYDEYEESDEEDETADTSEFKDVTNESGFTALPAGSRSQYYDDENDGEYGSWWCSEACYGTLISYQFDIVIRNDGQDNEKIGSSVRCVKN